VSRWLKAWRASWSLRRIPRSGGRPYLERRGRAQTLADARQDRERGTWRARLHHFVGPDDAGHHNHPFKWAFSIVLSVLWGGSYTEEVLDFSDPYGWAGAWDGSPTVRTRRVRLFNWIPNGKYHRITELHGDVWTLFVTGPRVTSWGFWVPGRGHVHHRQYNKEQGNDEREADDT
jgi:hypothetical protein